MRRNLRFSFNRSCFSGIRFLFCLGASLAVAGTLSAQTWKVVNLHPAGATTSTLSSTDGTKQGGTANGHAALWRGTPASFISLHPVGADSSYVYGVGGSQEVGYSVFGPNLVAGLWSGTSASFVNLHPAGAVSSYAYVTDGTTQAGYFNTAVVSNAAIWTGTTASIQNLHPAGYEHSQIMAGGGGQQGGRVVIGGLMHAGIWQGTAISFVDLNPIGASQSLVRATDGTTQGGYGIFGGITHAGFWKGTAASFFDLHPTGATSSTVNAVSGTHQAGYTHVAGNFRAAFWSSTAASYVDLQDYLPAHYLSSMANGIWTDGTIVEVAGQAYNLTEMREEAILWKINLKPHLPVVKVKGKTRLTTSSSALRIRGTAHDLDGDLERVEVKVGKRPYQNAKGGPAKWSYMVRLKPGTNRVLVRALDAEGASSKLARLRIKRETE